MKKILLIMFIIFPLFGFCQSYVFYPEIKTEAKQGLDEFNISIVFKDSRVFEKKLKEKCTKAEIFAEFANCIKQTYPNIRLTILDENKFNENPAKGMITIKINLQKYDATFYTGIYIANTQYEVKIFDYRDEENIINEIISGEGRQFNALGFTSGKIASNSSFKEAFDRFISMLDKLALSTKVQKDNKQKESQQNNSDSKSKVHRLRELKQLFDEKVLTQEEFEKEKKKILDEKE